MKGPLLKEVPDGPEDMKSLSYTSLLDGLAGKLRMSEDLLRAIDPGKAFDKAARRSSLRMFRHGESAAHCAAPGRRLVSAEPKPH